MTGYEVYIFCLLLSSVNSIQSTVGYQLALVGFNEPLRVVSESVTNVTMVSLMVDMLAPHPRL